jgi:hypothetical protein
MNAALQLANSRYDLATPDESPRQYWYKTITLRHPGEGRDPRQTSATSTWRRRIAAAEMITSMYPKLKLAWGPASAGMTLLIMLFSILHILAAVHSIDQSKGGPPLNHKASPDRQNACIQVQTTASDTEGPDPCQWTPKKSKH